MACARQPLRHKIAVGTLQGWIKTYFKEQTPPKGNNPGGGRKVKYGQSVESGGLWDGAVVFLGLARALFLAGEVVASRQVEGMVSSIHFLTFIYPLIFYIIN